MLFSSLVSTLVARVQAYRDFRRRLRELESLDDRELRELGLSRVDLYDIARIAA